MRVSTAALALVAVTSGTNSVFAFLPPVPQHRQSSSTRMVKDFAEFDYLLTEGGNQQQQQQQQQPFGSRRRIALPSSSSDTRATVLASSVAAPMATTMEGTDFDQTNEQEISAIAGEEVDPYADTFESQMGKIQQFQEKQQQGVVGSMEQKLKQMDLQDIVATLIIPSIALFAAGRWGYNRVAGRVAEQADATLDAFAREMIYHDGDTSEMQLCVNDYSRKLVWMGPKKTDVMLKRYLASYAKKKTVSPQAISSLSYVFNIFKLSEEKAAGILVSLCRELGPEKISSAGKLLFLGSRILKSREGVKALEPIKDMIKSTYRDATVAASLVETSQQAMAEAAYRTAVQDKGKNQKKLTVGWEVLGLDREAAERIFKEVADEGFVSYREAMYGSQTQKYDKKGRRINEEGKLENPEEAEDDEDDDSNQPVSNVYECSQCGYTLFVAQGRESKFFGNDFKCPECGAPKDKFQARDDFGED